jgi:hypothetical protein
MTDEVVYLSSVFTLSGVPEYNFVKPTEWNRLITSLRTPGRGLVLEGPSGIGKTTCLIKALEELGLPYEKLESRNPKDLEYIAALPSLGDVGIVVIDDFHRLDNSIKRGVADHMKLLADSRDPNSKVVVVGINKAGDALVAFGRDLNDRIDTIRFETNPEYKVLELIERGEQALNIALSNRPEIASEAQGSFHLAQMLCHQECLTGDILERCKEPTQVNVSLEIVRERVLEDQHRSFYATARRFASGPKLRREGRAPYLHLLMWLASSNEWTLSLDEAKSKHPELKGSISQIVDKSYLEEFILANSDLSDVMHYDNATRMIGVEDPKFLYYIRNINWNNFARGVGFLNLTFTSRYDFALSFAGADRDIAEKLWERLQAAECEAFYDKNEQHRIAAENLEEYLGPIYRSEARFVIAVLGPQYPHRIWTKFESDQFKERFGDSAVIPIWDANDPPTFFDTTRNVGGFVFDRLDPELEKNLDHIAEALLRKLHEENLDAIGDDELEE